MALEVQKISKYGYDNCISLNNKSFSVLIEPNCGGRIVEYCYKGRNILYVNPNENGYLYDSGNPPLSSLSPCGGRCDIGPEMMMPPHPVLWLGSWDTIHADKLGVILRSKKDPQTGLQLERFFKLDETSSFLIFTQTIRNLSDETISCFHWSRTFATGGGIVVAPLNPKSRYPKGYLTYGDGDVINYRPLEPNVLRENGLFVIKEAPLNAKFALDIPDGWLGYVSLNDLLFVKKFHVCPTSDYGEIAANNLSIWYNKNDMVELEPIGPVEILEPGHESSFTEDWWLMPFNHKSLFEDLNFDEIKELIDSL